MRSCWLGSSLPDDLLDLAIDFDWLQFNEYTDFMVCIILSGCSDFNDWPMSVCSNGFILCMINKKRAGMSPVILEFRKRCEKAVPGLAVTAWMPVLGAILTNFSSLLRKDLRARIGYTKVILDSEDPSCQSELY